MTLAAAAQDMPACPPGSLPAGVKAGNGMEKEPKNKEEKQKNGKRSAVLLFYLMTGVYGILLLFGTMDTIRYQEWAVYGCAAAVCLILWYFFSRGKKYFLRALAGICGCWILAAVLLNRVLAEQAGQIWEELSGSGNPETADVTAVMLLGASALVCLLFLAEFAVRAHWAAYLLTTFLLLAAPLAGVEVSLGAAVLLALFQVFFWGTARPWKRKHFLFAEESEPGRKKRQRFLGALLAAVLTASALLVLPNLEFLYGSVYQAEGFFSRSFQRTTGQDERPITGGHVSNGNNYRTGSVQLEVTVSQQPEEVLYLKGFTGDTYTGGEWQELDEYPLFTRMADTLHWEQWESWIRGMLYSMYYVLGQSGLEDGQEPMIVDIVHSSQDYRRYYMPYNGQWTNQRGGREDGYDGYAFRYYPAGSLRLNWDQIPEDMEIQAGWYREILEAYLPEVSADYTQVSAELLPRLTEFCRENPHSGLEEITGFILSVLDSQTTYTLTPGRAPLNEDIVEYFLFESVEGYCVHYASAAVLMYRLYGIPARYAAGYALQPSQFVQQEDGTWKAEVTDESAHAWAEIFMEDYDWVPVEVTPSADGQISSTGYPGFDAAILSQFDTSGLFTGTRRVQRVVSADSRDRGTGFSISLEPYENQLWAAGGIAVVLVCLIPLFLDYRRLRAEKRLERKDCKTLFRQYIRMLHFAGYLQEYSGEEEEFPGALAGQLPAVSGEEAESFWSISMEAVYGKDPVTAVRREYVLGIYKRTAAVLWKELKGAKKLTFRYFHCFG